MGCLGALLLLLALCARPGGAVDAVLDLGSTNYLVGTLKKAGVGNPIEMVLNSQSKRSTPTLIGFDGELFHVGEHAVALQKTKPGLIFKDFVGHLDRPILEFAVDPSAPELQPLANYTASLLVTALMHHIIEEQVRLSPAVSTTGSEPDKVDVTLIVPAALPLHQVTAMKDVVENLRGARLLTTVPTPTAAVISYLSSRVPQVDRELYPLQHYVILDVGSHTTEVSIVESQITPAGDPKAPGLSDVSVTVTATASLPVGGAHITEAIIEKYVAPQISHWEAYASGSLKLRNLVFQAVEKAKTSLAANTEIKIHVDDVTESGNRLAMVLTREQLSECVSELYREELMEEAFGPIREQLRDLTAVHFAAFRRGQAEREALRGVAGAEEAGEAAEKADAEPSSVAGSSAADSDASESPAYPLYLFYGGSSRVLAVQTLLERFFNASIQKYVNVEEGAIFGASLVAARHGSGFKINHRFMPSDGTRPALFYILGKNNSSAEAADGSQSAQYEEDWQEWQADLEAVEKPVSPVVPGDLESVPGPDGEMLGGRTLFRLNPYIRKSIQKNLPAYNYGDFYLGNDSFGITYQNESKSVREENGTNKTVTSMTYNTHTVNLTYLRTLADPLYTFEMVSPGNLASVCKFSLPRSKAQELTDKANRRGTVKWRHVKQAQEEASKVDAANEKLLALLEERIANETLQDDYKLKLVVNVTTDGSSLPTVDFAEIQLQNWTAVNREREKKAASDRQGGEGAEEQGEAKGKGKSKNKDKSKDKSKDKAKKPEITVLDIPLQVSCSLDLSPEFQTDPEEFRQNVHFLKKCETIKETRTEYEEKLNSIENCIYASRDILETYPVSEGEDGDFVLYKSEEQELRSMSSAADEVLREISGSAPCGADIHCVNLRLDRVKGVLENFERCLNPIQGRIKEGRCRPHSLDKLEQGMAVIDAAIVDMRQYLGPTLKREKEEDSEEGGDGEEGKNLTPDEPEVDGEEATKKAASEGDSNKPGDSVAPPPEQAESEPDVELSPETQALIGTMETCKALQDVDVNALLEQNKQSQSELKAEKAESDRKKAETSWLKKLFSSETRKEEKRLKLMEEELFYSRAMLKKIKKAVSDCTYIESQHGKMIKAYEALEKQMSKTREMLGNVRAELANRPVTRCGDLDDLTERNAEEVQRAQRFIKEVRTTIENGKIDKLMASLQKSSLKIRDGIQRLQALGELMSRGTARDIAEHLTRYFDVKSSVEKMDAAVSRFLEEQRALISELADAGTETYADLEKRVRDWFQEQLADPEEEGTEGEPKEGEQTEGEAGSGRPEAESADGRDETGKDEL